MKRFLSLAPAFLFCASLFAQENTTTDNDAAGAVGGIMGLGCTCIFIIAMIGIQIAIAIWVYRDAKSRGMENAMLLTILTVFTGILGLIIYLLMRPKTKVIVPPSGPTPPL